MRKRIFDIIEVAEAGDKASAIYDYTMMVSIIFSLIPLAFKSTTSFLTVIDRVTVSLFILDYILRLMTADYKLKKGILSFFLYPFTFMAIIDLLCILPSFNIIATGFKMLKLLRLLRAFRVFRAFKMLRYSKSMEIIIGVIRSQRTPLLAVVTLAIAYILIAALVVFNVEPETFKSFFEAVYWATVSLTTVGYGDIYPVTTIGRLVTMVSSFIGIAIVALPSGIITAGYMEALRNENNDTKQVK